MGARKPYTDRLVIVFVALGLLLLVGFSSLVMINNKVLADKVYFVTVLNDASGLSRKPPVYFKGLEIGRVDSFDLDFDSNDIRVRFYVYQEYADKILRYSVFSRMGNRLLGTGNEYEILLPQRPLSGEFEPLPEGELVPFVGSELGQDYVRRGNIEVRFDGIEGILTTVNEVLVNLKRVTDPQSGEIYAIFRKVDAVADSMLVVAQQFEEAQLAAETANMLSTLNQALGHADEVITDIEKVAAIADEFFVKADDVAAKSKVLADSATSGFETATLAFENANSVIEQIRQTVIKTDGLIASMEQVVAHADVVLAEYDDPGSIIDNASANKIPATIDNINTSLTYLQAILKEVYLQREQLAQAIVTMNRTLRSFDKTLQGVNNNPLLKDGIDPVPADDLGIEVQ